MLGQYDGEWVTGDTGEPLLIVLRDGRGIKDPSGADRISVRFTPRTTNQTLIVTATAAPAPKPVDGNPATVVSYNWGEGGADFVGEVEVRCQLHYLTGTITFPSTEQPLLLIFTTP